MWMPLPRRSAVALLFQWAKELAKNLASATAIKIVDRSPHGPADFPI